MYLYIHPGKGIGQQERTANTQKLWDDMNKEGGGGGVDPQMAMEKIRYIYMFLMNTAFYLYACMNFISYLMSIELEII
jgi:hypothetical protein